MDRIGGWKFMDDHAAKGPDDAEAGRWAVTSAASAVAKPVLEEALRVAVAPVRAQLRAQLPDSELRGRDLDAQPDVTGARALALDDGTCDRNP